MAALSVISPAVVIEEQDLTQLPATVAGIGAGMVGTTQDGPAFDPIIVKNPDEYTSVFGGKVPTCMLPYAAGIYLKNASSLTVCRVLCPPSDSMTEVNAGWVADKAYAITGSAGEYLAIIYLSGAADLGEFAFALGADYNKFALEITPAGADAFVKTGSFQSGSTDYITKVLNTDPKQYFNASASYWVDVVYQHQVKSGAYDLLLSGSILAGTAPGLSIVTTTMANHEVAFTSGSTPWVLSQLFGLTESGSLPQYEQAKDHMYKLFRLHTRGHGLRTKHNVKMEIRNIKPSINPDTSDFGTFDLLIRKGTDTDKAPVVLESFLNLSLDPFSKNYIVRRIGDVHNVYDTTLKRFKTFGSFGNRSNHIWVEMFETIPFPGSSLPWGFEGYTKIAAMPQIPFAIDQKDTNNNGDDRICWGVEFNSGSVFEAFRPVPPDATATTGSDFSLCHVTAVSGAVTDQVVYDKNYYGSYPTLGALSYTIADDTTDLASANAKFVAGFYGGNDGWAPWWKDPIDPDLIDQSAGYGFATDVPNSAVWKLSGQANKSGSYQARYALKQAIDIFSLSDLFNINLFVVPGIYSQQISPYAISMCEKRKDCFFVGDVSGSTVDQATGWADSRQYDSSYAGLYYPDLYIDDDENNVRKRVKPSVVVPGDAFAYTDRYAYAHYAPAGFTRGGLKSAVAIADKLNVDDRDALYSHRVNPIAYFPNEGIVVWGQRTTQVKESALDRINVRRMVLSVKKSIATAAKYLVFEPNTQAVWTRFVNLVDPILREVLLTYGIDDYRIQCDSNLNTQDVIDRNIMKGRVVVKPTRAIEFIPIEFVLSNNTALFET